MISVRAVKRVYYGLEFLHWFAVALPLPLSVLLIQARGLDLFQIGVLFGLYSFTIVLLELPTGGLADAIGRKPVALLAALFMLGSISAFLVSFSVPAFALAFVLLGVSRALSSGALGAWFVDSLLEAEPELDLQPSLAQAGTFTILGLTLGTLVGGLIPQLFPNLPPDGSAVFTPLAMTLVFSFGVKLIGTLGIVLFVRERRVERETAAAGVSSVPRILGEALTLSRRNPIVLLLLAASFVGTFALMSVETFWQPRFAGWLGGSTENSITFGLLMTGAFAVGVVGNLASIPLSRLLGKRYGLVAALMQVVAGLAVVALALQTTAPFAAAFFWLYYLSNAASGSPVGTIFNDAIPSERRSSMHSVISLAGFGGSLLGSVALGFLAETVSVGAAWLVAGGVLTLSAGLYLRVERLRSAKGPAAVVQSES